MSAFPPPHSSDAWCTMSGLDSYGSGGGESMASIRELCARAMAIVYQHHRHVIGPFDGTAHLTVLLDRTTDRPLRHRMMLLLKVGGEGVPNRVLAKYRFLFFMRRLFLQHPFLCFSLGFNFGMLPLFTWFFSDFFLAFRVFPKFNNP